MMNDIHLPTKTALITGASSGLGRAFAFHLGARGYDLILVARREDRLRKIADKIQSDHHCQITVIRADLSKTEDIETIVTIINNTKNIDLLVNNAGFGILRRFSRTEVDKVNDFINVQLEAPVRFCKAALSNMLNQNHGAIINVSSLAGMIPIKSVLYGSGKAFLINFSQALQEELIGTQIRVQALCPGFVTTEFHDTPEYKHFKRSTIPKFLWMAPESVVAASLAGLERDQLICIPGTINKIAGFLARNSLSGWAIKIISRYILRRRK